MNIYVRKRPLVNEDPQSHCYNGVHHSPEFQWTEWKLLETNVLRGNAEMRLAFWRSLNDYAISHKGHNIKCEFKVEE